MVLQNCCECANCKTYKKVVSCVKSLWFNSRGERRTYKEYTGKSCIYPEGVHFYDRMRNNAILLERAKNCECFLSMRG